MDIGLKLKIIEKAIEIKINRGENLEDILNSYKNLTEEEKEVIRKNIEDIENIEIEEKELL